MKCPTCGTEAVVMAAAQERRDGAMLRVLEFRCRNKRCPDCGRTVGRQAVQRSLTMPETAVMEHTGKEAGP